LISRAGAAWGLAGGAALDRPGGVDGTPAAAAAAMLDEPSAGVSGPRRLSAMGAGAASACPFERDSAVGITGS
jgi:hypothetical protein